MNKNNREVKEFIKKIKKHQICLKEIDNDKELIIGKTTGKKIIVNSQSMFTSGIDYRFEEYGLCLPDVPTVKTSVHIYETIKKTTFSKIFFGENLDDMCFTQNQIIKFCKKYSYYLKKDDRTTLFLYKKNGSYFVIGIYKFFDGLDVFVNSFELNIPLVSCGHRIIFPKKINV